MNIEAVKNVVTRFGNRGLLVGKKHGPAILTGAGLVGGVVTTVLASKATLRLEPIVDELKEHAEIVKERHQTGVTDDSAHRKEIAYIYTRKSLDIAKLYAPAASVGVLSAACIISAQGIMQRRNAALTAAYIAVEKGFSEYRKRVEEALGEDKELELRYGMKDEETHDTEKGEVIIKKMPDPNAISPYARFFDEGNINWTRQAEYNLLFIKGQQNYANDLLRTRGHVFLNDVYDMLGIERSSAGQVVGWVLSKDGDNFVDFGIYRGDREKAREFVNGQERSILLDFNVDGVVYDKI